MRRHLWALTLMVLGNSGCSFEAASPAVANQCVTNADCKAGEICDHTIQACVSDQEAGYEVVLRVTAPATDTAFPQVRFGPLPIDGPVGPRDLEVKGTVSLRGRVSRDGEPLVVELVFKPGSVSNGPAPETLTVRTSSELSDSEDSADYNFALTLLADTDYEVSVLPVGETARKVPPRQLRLTAEEVQEGFLAVEYDDLREVTGRLVNDGHADRGSLAVQAVDPETGQPVSNRVLTGVGGDFDLQIDESLADDADWAIEVGPSSERPWFGVWRADPEHGDLSRPDQGRYDVVVTLPELPPIVEVLSTVERVDTFEKVPGASVTFSGEIELKRNDGSATTARVLRTAQSAGPEMGGTQPGTVRLRLWAGSYDVATVPPTEPPSAALLAPAVRRDFLVANDSVTQSGDTFQLPPRNVMEGVVTTANGAAVPGSRVRAVSLVDAGAGDDEDDGGIDVAALSRSSSTTTGPEGQYVLLVDFGRFDLVFESPTGSGYPWAVVPDVVLDSTGKMQQRNVELGSPVVLKGEVSFDSGRAPAGAVVAAFADLGGDEGARYVQIGRASVADDGSYTLYLPPSLPSGGE